MKIKLGHCLECKRLMPIKWLKQIEYYEGHLVIGEMHHKLVCLGCIKKAEELGDVFGDKPFKTPNIENEKYF